MQFPACQQHPWNVKRPLPEASLGQMGRLTVSPQPAIPFAISFIDKPAPRPIVNFLVPLSIEILTRQLPCHERGDFCLIMRPPEFHVVPILGAGLSAKVAKIEKPAAQLIPTKPPAPAKHCHPKVDQPGILPILAFRHHEPGRFNGMPWVDRPAFRMI